MSRLLSSLSLTRGNSASKLLSYIRVYFLFRVMTWIHLEINFLDLPFSRNFTRWCIQIPKNFQNVIKQVSLNTYFKSNLFFRFIVVHWIMPSRLQLICRNNTTRFHYIFHFRFGSSPTVPIVYIASNRHAAKHLRWMRLTEHCKSLEQYYRNKSSYIVAIRKLDLY